MKVFTALLFGEKMKHYKIADYNVLLNCGRITMHNAEKYLCDDEAKIDFEIVTDINAAKKRYPSCEKDVAVYLWDGYRFCLELLKRGDMRLHSSAVVVDNKAYLFSAPCGTGKSTHTGKWLELFGDKAYILNDDKPALRIINGVVYAYGTPWSGKNDISVNKRVEVAGICFLNRSQVDTIKRITPSDSIELMLSGGLKRLNYDNVIRQLEITEKIAKIVPIYSMGCTPTIAAAEMAYNEMSEKKV